MSDHTDSLAGELTEKLQRIFGKTHALSVEIKPGNRGVVFKVITTLSINYTVKIEDLSLMGGLTGLAVKNQVAQIIAYNIWREAGKISGTEEIKQLLTPSVTETLRRRLSLFGPVDDTVQLLLDIHEAVYRWPPRPPLVQVGSADDD